MPNLFDNVGQTTASAHSGTGSYTLTGTGAAAITGFDTFAGASIPNGTSVSYLAKMGADWEVGAGTYSTGGTLSRDRIFRSSNGGLAVNWAAGSKSVYITASAAYVDGLYPTAKGILVGIEVLPNIGPYFARRTIGRAAGHPIRVNGGDSYDGSAANFQLEIQPAVDWRDWIGLPGRNVVVKSAPFTVNTSEIGTILAITTGASGDDVTLPLSASAGRGAPIVLTNATNNTLDIVRSGSDTIAFSRTAITFPPGSTVVLMADGTAAYHVVFYWPGYGTSAGQVLTTVAAGLPGFAALSVPAAASAAEMEAGASSTAFVTPALAQRHPSAAKGWVTFDASSGAPVVGAYYNLEAVTPITDNGTGDFTINWAQDFAGGNYTCVCQCGPVGANSPGLINGAAGWSGGQIQQVAPTAGAYRVATYNHGYTAPIDNKRIEVIAFGDQ